MASYICPFSNSVCKESCSYWKKEPRKETNPVIPFSISLEDVIMFMPKNIQPVMKYVSRYMKKDEDVYLPHGRCTKLDSC